jgi:M6 family metalloprotease-like protein
MKNTYYLTVIFAVFVYLLSFSVTFAHENIQATTTQAAVVETAASKAASGFFPNLFSKVRNYFVPDSPVSTPHIESMPITIPVIPEQKDLEIKKFETQLRKTDAALNVQTTVRENPILNKIIPAKIASNDITWKTIEEFDRLLAKIAEKNPTTALAFIERRNVIRDKQVLRAPVTKISAKNITIEINHFDYDNSDKTNYFGTYMDGRVARTVFSEQFRGLGGQYRIAQFSGYQFGNYVLVTQMTGFEPIDGNDGNLHTRSTSDTDYKILVLLVDYLDSDPAQQLTNAQTAHEIFFDGDLHDFFYEQSYEKMDMTGDVYGWYTLQSNAEGTYCNPLRNDNASMLSFNNQELLNYMIADGIQIDTYDHVMIIANCKNVTGGGFAGKITPHSSLVNEEAIGMTYSNFNIPGAVVKTSNGSANLHTMAHELGHYLYGAPGFQGGLSHASARDCGSVTNAPSGCVTVEYGNYYDALGSWQAFSNHFRVGVKEYFGWLEPEQILTVTESSGEEEFYTLTPLERMGGFNTSLGDHKMVKLQPTWSSSPLYVLEYRQALGFDSNLSGFPLGNNTDGIFIYKLFGSNNSVNVSLLDMVPQDIPWEEDVKHVTLNVGRTYVDEELGVTINMINANPQHAFFQVTYAGCERTTPTSFWNNQLSYRPPESGELYRYFTAVYYHNNDTISCLPSMFLYEMSADDPIGFIIQQDSVIMVGHNEAPTGISFYITIPIGTPPGNYHLYLTITNQNSGQSTTQTIPITVN